MYVVGADHCKWKIAEFQKSLRERGVVRSFTGFEDVSIFSPFFVRVNGSCKKLERSLVGVLLHPPCIYSFGLVLMIFFYRCRKVGVIRH